MIKEFIEQKRPILIKRTALMERNVYDMWAIRILAILIVIVIEVGLFLMGGRTPTFTIALMTIALIAVILWFTAEISMDFIYNRYSKKFWNDVDKYRLDNNIDGKNYFSRKYTFKVTLVELMLCFSVFLILSR